MGARMEQTVLGRRRAATLLAASGLTYAGWAAVLLIVGNPQFGLSPGQVSYTRELSPIDYLAQLVLATSELTAMLAVFWLARWARSRPASVGGLLAIVGHAAGAALALWHVAAGVAIGPGAARIHEINSALFTIETSGVTVGWGVLGGSLARRGFVARWWAVTALLFWPLSSAAALALGTMFGSLAGAAVVRSPAMLALAGALTTWRPQPRLRGVSWLALVACAGPALMTLAAVSQSLAATRGLTGPATVFLGLSVASLGIGLRRVIGPRARIGASVLAVLAVAVLCSVGSDQGLLPAGGVVRQLLSGAGALCAFILGPLALAYAFAGQRAWRLAALVSAAVPVIFVVSLVLDGPLLPGIGSFVDATDALAVLVWLETVAILLLHQGAAWRLRPLSVHA